MCTAAGALNERKLLIALLIVHLSMLIHSACVHSPVADEIAHIAAGLSHWQLGDFALYRVNPPLARMVATSPIFLLESGQQEWLELYLNPGEFGRTEFTVGQRFMELMQADGYYRWLVMARVASSLFSILGAVVCFAWAKELYGGRAGLLASVLWCFSPMVLGFGAIVTPDVPSAATGVLALYTFSRWLRSPNWADAYFAGIALGFAELTKMTWIILPPLMILLWVARLVVGWLRSRRMAGCYSLPRRNASQPPAKRSVELAQGAMLAGLAWLVFMAGYGFQGAFQRLGDYKFRSTALAGDLTASGSYSGNRFRGTPLEHLPLPVPQQFVLGFDYQKREAEPGRHSAFLGGELREEGWWYYYLYALAVKCTVGGLALFLAASLRRLWLARPPKLEEWLMLSAMGLVLLVLSSHTGLNQHSRYLITIFPLAIIWSSQVISMTRSPRFQVLVVLVAGSAVVSSLSVFPHSMSYFNELAGGARQGRYHLSNSNVDWAQDLFFLKREMQRRGWQRIGLLTQTNYSPSYWDIDYFLPPIAPQAYRRHGSRPPPGTEPRLEPGVYAISICHVQGFPRNVRGPDGATGAPAIPHAYSYFQQFEPVGMVGYSMLLYELSEENIRASSTWGEG